MTRSRWSRSIRQAPARPARRRTVMPAGRAAATAAATGAMVAMVAVAATDALAPRSHHRLSRCLGVAFRCKLNKQSDASTWCADHIVRALISRHMRMPNTLLQGEALAHCTIHRLQTFGLDCARTVARRGTSDSLVVYISANGLISFFSFL